MKLADPGQRVRRCRAFIVRMLSVLSQRYPKECFSVDLARDRMHTGHYSCTICGVSYIHPAPVRQ